MYIGRQKVFDFDFDFSKSILIIKAEKNPFYKISLGKRFCLHIVIFFRTSIRKNFVL